MLPLGQPQLPFVHTRPAGQAVPHAPQFWISVARSTHARSQSVSAPQSGAHAPDLHTWADGQAVPHAPQFAGSVVTFAQAEPHCIRPVAHTHAPPMHVVPGMQTAPHVPQFALFVCVSVQLAPHNVPVVQVQLPFVHDWPAAHALPQVPQWVVSVVLTHVPLQFVSPPEQEQAPATHELPGMHAMPHAPQFALFVCVSMQAPAHWICPEAQGAPPPVPPVGDVPPPPSPFVPPSGLVPQASAMIEVTRKRRATFRPWRIKTERPRFRAVAQLARKPQSFAAAGTGTSAQSADLASPFERGLVADRRSVRRPFSMFPRGARGGRPGRLASGTLGFTLWPPLSGPAEPQESLENRRGRALLLRL